MTDTPVLQFLGGTGTVTGSKFLVRYGDAAVLVDCGLYQGLKELRLRNWEELPFDPATLDAVVLTHAHLDHCGWLPALVKAGFGGPVVCTEGTAALVEIVLRDAAHLQEEDALYAARAGFSRHHPPRPLYDSADAEKAILLLRPIEFGRRTTVAPGIELELRFAGHILGASSAHLRLGGHSVLFSGDLGRGNHPLLLPPQPPPAADTVVVESTYGDRMHPVPDPEALAGPIRRTVNRGGVVVIPSFAVDRTEVVLFRLRELMRSGAVPRLPVFVDSPMALAALRVYRDAIAAGSPELRPDLDRDGDPFDTGQLHEVTSVEGSMRLNSPHAPCIIVAASGMATGGRVVHHLKHLLPDPRNTVVLVGYQPIGTRGRDLSEGARQLKIHGRYVPVRADVVVVDEFSVHADGYELMHWLGQLPSPPRTCYVVHGEPSGAEALADRLQQQLGWCAVVPRYGERVRLD
jgi:metallo-beta-lactamase family protein